MVTGCIIEKVTGRTFRECLDDYIFGPLGMRSSTVDKRAMTEGENAAVPYAGEDPYEFKGQVKPIDLYISNLEKKGLADEDPLLATGEICSNVEDLLKWADFHLNEGRADGRQLISRENLLETHRCQMVIPYPEKDGKPVPGPAADVTSDDGYGLAWFTDTYRGHEHIHHGGNIDGFSSLVSFVPDLGLGFVLLVNIECFAGRYDVEHRVIDAVLGTEDIDWTKRYMAEARKDRDELREEIEKLQNSPDKGKAELPLPVSEYCGTYSAKGYEDIEITEGRGVPVLHFAGFEIVLDHVSDNEFAANSTETDLAGSLPVIFDVEDGHVKSFSIKLNFEPGTDLIGFSKN